MLCFQEIRITRIWGEGSSARWWLSTGTREWAQPRAPGVFGQRSQGQAGIAGVSAQGQIRILELDSNNPGGLVAERFLIVTFCVGHQWTCSGNGLFSW